MTEHATEKTPAPAEKPARAAAPAASSEAVRHSMQGNKRTDTKPELLVRERLRKAGYPGYRLQWKVPGRPDIAYPGRKLAIFVNGCFWHRCPICSPSSPKTHVEYWEAKFSRNVERDAENERKLREMGWEIVTVWECELKRDKLDETMERLVQAVELAGKRAREEHAAAHERWLARKTARKARQEEGRATGGRAAAAETPGTAPLSPASPAPTTDPAE